MINDEMTDGPEPGLRKAIRGFVTCAAICLMVVGIAFCNNFRRQFKRSTPTDDELAKIAALLHADALNPDFKIERYEFNYNGIWMDKFGASGAQIARESGSSSWEAMLKHWQKLNELPSDFNRLRMHKWVSERMKPSTPVYVRWVNISFSEFNKQSGSVKSHIVPQLCCAFPDKENPDVFYVSTEGELMFPQCTLVPGETTGTLDWSRFAWD